MNGALAVYNWWVNISLVLSIQTYKKPLVEVEMEVFQDFFSISL